MLRTRFSRLADAHTARRQPACVRSVPMISFAEQLEVPCAPDIAFELLADMAELDRWNPNVPSSRRVSGERFEPGSRYQSVLARGPIRLTARSELVTVEPGRRVEYQGSIAWFWSVDSMEFVADGETARASRSETRRPDPSGSVRSLERSTHCFNARLDEPLPGPPDTSPRTCRAGSPDVRSPSSRRHPLIRRLRPGPSCPSSGPHHGPGGRRAASRMPGRRR